MLSLSFVIFNVSSGRHTENAPYYLFSNTAIHNSSVSNPTPPPTHPSAPCFPQLKPTIFPFPLNSIYWSILKAQMSEEEFNWSPKIIGSKINSPNEVLIVSQIIRTAFFFSTDDLYDLKSPFSNYLVIYNWEGMSE